MLRLNLQTIRNLLGVKLNMNIKTVGSVCSGIEAASIAWKPLGLNFEWFSEIADFPSRLLKEEYPEIENLGDMTELPQKILNKEITAPDLICGGTPCQAFSLAGWKNGLEDSRGNLTLSFVDIIEANDKIRNDMNMSPSIVFWENVEGVLNDKTNAFGSFLSSLAGLDEVISNKKWANAGLLRGPKRNIAWRVIDSKYFGLPQQRRRVYVLAGGKEFNPENVLFELNQGELGIFEKSDLQFKKSGVNIEIFREYTDVLYSAYGTKWNGNAAAYNGSLYVSQDNKLRRLSPLECERLMGFPDNYTNLEKSKKTNRYQALGNSWSVPVIKFLGTRLLNPDNVISKAINESTHLLQENKFFEFNKKVTPINNIVVNSSEIPEDIIKSNFYDIIDIEAPSDIYISPVGCAGILRRKVERNLKMNIRLESIMQNISSQMSKEEVEKRSRIQKRGDFSINLEKSQKNKAHNIQNAGQLALF